MQAATPLASRPAEERAPTRARSLGDLIFGQANRIAGIFVLALLGAIILMLFLGALPAFRHFGFGFLWSAQWDPVADRYGALVAIYGTLITSVLSLVFAVPVAFGIAFFLTELAPEWFRRPVGIAIELLAAVPSIIYGMWGFFVLVPFLNQYIYRHMDEALYEVPVLNVIFEGPTYGTGVLTASLVLAIMILPFIAATMRDVFSSVPPVFKESAYGLGATTWEVVRHVVLPYTRASVVGGIMLGLGRALGETMAVTFVVGNANRISASLFAPGNTIASLVALEFPEAVAGSLKLQSLLALGFILFVISFVVLFVSRMLLRPRLET